jgi:glucan phosphoethanolaminetransferase (alkaline phosphatase superfamily)
MTNAPAPPTTNAPPVGPRSDAIWVQLGALAALLGSLAFIFTVLGKEGLSSREAFLIPTGIVGSAVATVGLAVLVATLPRLLKPLPQWAVMTATSALAFTLAVAWSDATTIPAIAATTTDATFDEIGTSWGLVALFAPKAVLGFIGFMSIAVTSWRMEVLSRGATVLIDLGAVAYLLPPFPPGLVLVSLGLLLASRTV